MNQLEQIFHNLVRLTHTYSDFLKKNYQLKNNSNYSQIQNKFQNKSKNILKLTDSIDSLIPFPDYRKLQLDMKIEIFSLNYVILKIWQKIVNYYLQISNLKLQDFSQLPSFLFIQNSQPFLIKILNGDFTNKKSEFDALLQTNKLSSLISKIGSQTLNHIPNAFLIEIFYPFLNISQPKLQKSKGVVYTPKFIIDFMLDGLFYFTHKFILKNSQKQSKGSLLNLLNNNNLIFHDPATGPLSFELEIPGLVNNKINSVSNIDEDFPFFKNFLGNELNIPAYFLGQFLLTDIIWLNNYPDLNLCPEYIKKRNSLRMSFNSALSSEFINSRLKQCNINPENSSLILFGNPPYSVSSSNKDKWILQLMKEYAVKEPNLTRLYDDYVKFLRYGQWLLEQFPSGIMGFITNRKFLDGKIYYGMRQSLLKAFDYIYIIDLLGDQRNIKSEEVNSNVFGIQTGVAISFFIKDSIECKDMNDSIACLNYTALKGSLDKIKNGLNQSLDSLEFQILKPEGPKYIFIPIDLSDENRIRWYEEGITLPDCFKKTSRALISSRDRFMINIRPEELKENINMLETRDFTQLRALGRVSKKLDNILENEVILQKFDFQEMRASITPITYRAFDPRYTIFYTINFRCGKSIILDYLNRNKELRENSKNIIDFADANRSSLYSINFVQSMQKSPYSHIFFGQGLIDSGLFGYSTSKVAPLWLDDEINLSKIIIDKFKLNNLELSQIQIFGYIYGLLHCDSFTELYQPILFHEYPRIIVVKDSKLVSKIANFGLDLMNLHIMNFNPSQSHLIKQEWTEIHHNLSKKFLIKEFCYSSITNKIKIVIRLELIPSKQNSKQVKDNETDHDVSIQIECYPDEWEYRIGSIQVLQNWLKHRTNKRLNSPLFETELLYFLKIVWMIRFTLQIKKSINSLFHMD